MGQRGPKPGWKRGFAVAVAPVEANHQEAAAITPQPEQPLAAAPAEQARLSCADLSNPAKLHGDALKKLAHTLGMAKSELARLDDDRIRTQLKYLTHRKYETEKA